VSWNSWNILRIGLTACGLPFYLKIIALWQPKKCGIRWR